MRNKAFILGIIGFFFILSGCIWLVVSSLQGSHQQMVDKQNAVEKYSNVFQENALAVQEGRKEYIEVVVEDLFHESVLEDYAIWIKQLTTYQQLVDQVIDSARELETLCIDQEYPDRETINSCDSYINNYETVMNYFVKDVENFNLFIEEYLSLYGNTNSNIVPFTIDSTRYFYLDVNDDGRFIGQN